MSSQSVYWGDGLFLRPHHFQQIEQGVRAAVDRSQRWTTPHSYGLYSLKADSEALNNWTIRLHSGEVCFRDGTALRFPEEAHIPAAEVPRDAFGSPDARLTVYLGIPELRRGADNSNVRDDQGVPQSRYVTQFERVEDENAAGNAEEMEFRRLNPRILLGEDATSGYDTIPIMRLKAGAAAEAPPALDKIYFPPVMRFGAWPTLLRLARAINDRFGAQSQQLATQMVDRGVSFASGNKEDFERILRLHATNEVLGIMAPLIAGGDVHPVRLYEGLCRAVGVTAIFRDDRAFPKVPGYDHDDLGPMFARLDRLLQLDDDPDPYQTRPFKTDGKQMSVRLEKEWLGSEWSFFIGVRSSANSGKVQQLLSERELCLKIASTEEVDEVFRLGDKGVRLIFVGDAPRAFPREDWHYYQVERGRVWQRVEKSLNLGMRFNERYVAQHTDGSNRIEAKDRRDNGTVTMEFTLFASPAAR